jgi:hypothetical protein
MPGGYVCSASMKSTAHADVRETLLEGRPLRKVFSKEQQGLLRGVRSRRDSAGRPLGSGPDLRSEVEVHPKEPAARHVAEVWLHPDKTRILELSTKCAPAESFLAAAEVRVFLTKQGVDLSGEQETKTQKALEFFSRR